MNLLRRYFSRSIVVATVLISLLLVFSFLSPVIAMADSVSHFRIHLIVLLMVLVLLTGLLGRRHLAIAGVIVVVLGLVSISPYLFSNQAHAKGDAYQQLKLMQLNLFFMNRRLDSVARLARDRDVDVITLQEVNNRTGRLLKMLQKDYPYQVRCSFQAVGGIAVLSRLPLAQGSSSGCLSKTGTAWLRIKLGKQALTITSIHLHWPYPFSQYEQVSNLKKQLPNIMQPMIIAGDFNAVPWSHAVDRLANASQTRVTQGLRFSFYLNISGKILPIGLPIDHVLVPNDFIVESVELGPKAGSDHYSVFASIAVPGRN